MRIVNEGALYSDQSKLSVVFYLRAHSIQGNTVYTFFVRVKNELCDYVIIYLLVFCLLFSA